MRLILPIAILCVVISGCRSNLIDEPPVPTAREIAAEKLEPILPQVNDLLLESLQVRQLTADLRAVFDGERPANVREEDWLLVATLYSERQYEPVFVVQGIVSQAGEHVRHALADSLYHGMYPTDYNSWTIQDRLSRLVAAGAQLESFTGVDVAGTERDLLIETIAQQSELLDQDELTFRESVKELLFPSDPEAIAVVERLFEQYEALAQAERTIVEDGMAAEIELATGFVRFADDMRFSNPNWFDRDTRDDETLLAEARRQSLVDTFANGIDAGFDLTIEGLHPHHQQYARLVESLRGYYAIMDAGGWEEMEDVDVRIGRDYEIVPVLRRRLAVEGYFDGDLESEEFDRELRRAVQAYQRTHQFRDNGRISSDVVRSMNRSPEYRANQVVVALQRWRESTIGNDTYYIFTNINDYHTEVWRDGERDMRIRTIVGNNRLVERDGVMTYDRATPALSRTLRYIVFNPYWNVPRGIMEREYDPLLEEDPKWYQNNGFEIMGEGEHDRWVRQLPGPANALGQVKFLFPNPHDVYMHDTPNRGLFERTNRAFSHGCMRLENPLDLAEYLVGNDRGWDRERMDEQRDTGAEEWLTLRHPVPVHVEYYVVRVDDDGHANFFTDLYRRDRPRIADHVARQHQDAVNWAERHLSAGISAAIGAASSPQPEPVAPSETAAVQP